MVTWKLLDEATARAVWNDALVTFQDANPYQSFEWGEYRRRMTGRPALRWAAYDPTGRIVALFQGASIARMLGVQVVTSLGGPVGDLERALPSLTSSMLQTLRARHLYCAIGPRRELRPTDVALLTAAGWRRSAFQPGTTQTVTLDLSAGPEAVLRRSSSSYRENVRRGLKAGLDIGRWADPDPAEVIRVYRAMEALKGLSEELTGEEVAALAASFGDNLLLFRARDADGATMSLHGCLIAGPNALAIMIASNQAGRRVRASFTVLWRLLEECMRRGVRTYDLNGIDPQNNPGVHSFKKATGGRELEFLGYWDWATSPAVRILMATARRIRNRKKSQARPTAPGVGGSEPTA